MSGPLSSVVDAVLKAVYLVKMPEAEAWSAWSMPAGLAGAFGSTDLSIAYW